MRRAAVVVALVLGVLGMHSLVMAKPVVTVDVAKVGAVAVSGPAAAAAPAVGPEVPMLAGDHLETARVVVGAAMVSGMHACLAVLVAAAVVLLAALVGRSSRASWTGQTDCGVLRSRRAPPWRRPPSLTELSVLRV